MFAEGGRASMEAHSVRSFPYFATNSHSLIAVMLGTLRMDIQICVNKYLKLAPEISPVKGLI